MNFATSIISYFYKMTLMWMSLNRITQILRKDIGIAPPQKGANVFFKRSVLCQPSKSAENPVVHIIGCNYQLIEGGKLTDDRQYGKQHLARAII